MLSLDYFYIYFSNGAAELLWKQKVQISVCHNLIKILFLCRLSEHKIYNFVIILQNPISKIQSQQFKTQSKESLYSIFSFLMLHVNPNPPSFL